jgi:K(+)-stimulated pyrophosphate-energized sodium pump
MSFNEFPTTVLFLGIAAFSALIAVLYAYVLYRKMNQMKVDHQRINEISSYIHQGAMAFMKRQYRVIIYFAIGVGTLLALTELIPELKGAEGVGWKAAISFVVGATFAGLAGFVGMHAATKANAKTTYAAQTKGMPGALRQAFSGGSVLGLTVVGLGLFGLTFLFLIFYTMHLVVHQVIQENNI